MSHNFIRLIDQVSGLVFHRLTGLPELRLEPDFISV